MTLIALVTMSRKASAPAGLLKPYPDGRKKARIDGGINKGGGRLGLPFVLELFPA